MSFKKKNSKKSTQLNQSEGTQSNKPQSGTTILGISPRELGSVVAAAVIAEVSQVAVNKISQSVAQSSSKKLQDQLNPIGHSVKNVVGGVKDAIADAASASGASEVMESTLANGQSAAAEQVDRGVENAKETTATMAGIAQEQTDEVIDDTRQKADQTRDFVIAQIGNVIAGVQGRAGKTQHALDDTLDATQDAASATQKAIAQVIDQAVKQVKAILAGGSTPSKGNGKGGKKGKKAKKHKKGK